MNSLVIAGLVVLALYLAIRWYASREEAAQLRGQIAVLKRQLARRAS